jgi:tRNA (adenine37-N6)-methyltransferase
MHPPLQRLDAKLVVIGHVETNVADADVARRRRELVSDIVIVPEWEPALLGIEAYSHLIVLFWMDRAAGMRHPLTHPRGDESLARQGVLALRGSNHPNPIGLAVVELIARKANRLTVKRLDAFNNTPVIDLKPYDDYDSHSDIRVAEWFAQRRAPKKSH